MPDCRTRPQRQESWAMNDSVSSSDKNIVLLGASFTTGNLGVSALAWSSLKLIRNRWPHASIALVGVGRQPGMATVRLGGQQEDFPTWPVRYSPNVLTRHHLVGLWLAVAVCRFLPFLRKRLSDAESTLGALLRCSLVCDITGGDSFSDIYGLSRFLRGYVLKRVCQMTGTPFVLLPQTYGPFRAPLTRILARRILTRTTAIYSRDREGTAVVQELIGPSSKIRLCPDVAFILDSTRPKSSQVVRIEQLKAAGQRLIGLNISGLLYHGGYSQNNMFGLACDYPALITEILLLFCRQPGWSVLLVPHVLPPSDFAVEDDFVAAEKVLADMPLELHDRVIVLNRGYDQNESKYFIGLCDFFIGARMHATIAALSQAVPAVGLAYSRKFAGVFATAGVADCVLDLRSMNKELVLDGVRTIFDRREAIARVLQTTVPPLQHELLGMFDHLEE